MNETKNPKGDYFKADKLLYCVIADQTEKTWRRTK